MARRGAHRELNDWLDQHGYHHAHATKRQSTAHPYAVSSRMAHATRKTTVAGTKAAIRATGASVKYQDGEWQVNVPRGTEATAYYTNDADDAINTARSMMATAGVSRGHARKSSSARSNGNRLFIGTMPTGIRYADRHRERGGDYLPIAFLPYSTLQLEWEPRVPVALELREQIQRHADSVRARRGQDYPISSSGQTVRLGHARMTESPTGREVFASKERNHHITTHGRQTLDADQFALPPGPEEKRRGIKGRLPIDTLKRARNALSRAAQMKKRGHLSAAQLQAVQRKVHAAWPSIDVGDS
ncbi:MAG TPA: hypothetical protein VLE97_05770 [Gaiellaceae bacterium]|nr:hypothetical protein [Gaiellaceae bacterium]